MLQNNNSSQLIFFIAVANRITDVSFSLCNYPHVILFVCQSSQLLYSKKIFTSDQPIFNILNVDRRGG